MQNCGPQTAGETKLDVGSWLPFVFLFENFEPFNLLQGSIAITGAAVKWLRDNLGLIKSASETEELASSVTDNGDVYFVPAFSGLFAPYWQTDARGFVNLHLPL